MRCIIIALGCMLVTVVNAQTRSDSVQQVRNMIKLYDLEYTQAEGDSLLGNLNNYLNLYKGMHKTLPANNIPFPFAYNPAPAGFKIPERRIRINWNVPVTELPANKNDLAFYSIPQLASLIINRKITSVDLTKFYIDRLKKWGDTLECVITLTEDLALEQARQADQELNEGYYRGPLHGIPYGLKDLFAVKGYKTTW
jgi:hypothetical protein